MDIGHDAILAYSNGFVVFPLIAYGLLLIGATHYQRVSSPKVRVRPVGLKVLRPTNYAPTGLAPTLPGNLKRIHQRVNGNPRKSFWQSFVAFWGVVLTIIGFYTLLYPLNQEQFPTIALSAFFRAVTFAGWDMSTTYNGPREQLDYRASQPPHNNIIFIVDESVRADHLSLNGYTRLTTPYLTDLSQQGILHNWGQGWAGADCSLAANNLLLIGLNVSTKDDQLKQKPTIFQYAQAMGYKTYHLNATSNKFWLGTADDLNYIDEWWPRHHFGTEPDYDIDFTLAQKVSNLAYQSVGNFIWLNKRGLHFNYNSHYPPTAAHWLPVLTTRFHPQNRAELVNSYDNAIRYNVNTFFAHLLQTNPTLLENTIIVYTSDHGQTLSDHGETWTHCVGTPNELLVPIFIISSMPVAVNLDRPATHFNIFTTLLDLMAFPEAERDYDYAPSLLQRHKNVTTQPDDE